VTSAQPLHDALRVRVLCNSSAFSAVKSFWFCETARFLWGQPPSAVQSLHRPTSPKLQAPRMQHLTLARPDSIQRKLESSRVRRLVSSYRKMPAQTYRLLISEEFLARFRRLYKLLRMVARAEPCCPPPTRRPQSTCATFLRTPRRFSQKPVALCSPRRPARGHR